MVDVALGKKREGVGEVRASRVSLPPYAESLGNSAGQRFPALHDHITIGWDALHH